MVNRSKKAHHCEWCDISPKIWSAIDHGRNFPWRIKPTARNLLANLITPSEYMISFGISEPAHANQKHSEWAKVDWTLVNANLRIALSPYLVGSNRQRAREVAQWVVKSWGGIPTGRPEAIKDWSNELGHYDVNTVWTFVERQGYDRISSWSKLLSMADSANYAVYDSRVSIALNCALRILDDRRLFFMPTGRNGEMKSVPKKLVPQGCVKRRGYRDYLTLLNCFVCNGHAENLLGAEMVVFANAPSVANMI